MRTWGYHLLVNARGSEKSTDLVHSKKNIIIFLEYLMKKIKMQPAGKAKLRVFGDNKKIHGYTLVQMIRTSSITAHFVDCNGDVYIDIFSCKRYDPAVVIKLVEQYFRPVRIATCFIERDARKNAGSFTFPGAGNIQT